MKGNPQKNTGQDSVFGDLESVTEINSTQLNPEDSGEVKSWSKSITKPSVMGSLLSAYVVGGYGLLLSIGFLWELSSDSGKALENLQKYFSPLIVFALAWFRDRQTNQNR